MPEDSVKITSKDIQTVAQKLEQFSQQLSPSQRVVIDWLVERASSAGGGQPQEVQSALSGPPGAFSDQLERAMGLHPGRMMSQFTATVRVRT